MTAIRLFLARIRVELWPGVALALVVLVTAFLAAAAPRLFNRAADDALRYQIADATSVERNIQLGRITPTEQAPPPGSGMADAARIGAALEAELPDSVRRILGEESSFAESIRWTVWDSPPTRPGFVDLRFQAGLDAQIRLTDGRLPTGTIRPVSPPPDAPGADASATSFEVALSASTAAELGVTVGDRLDLLPDPDDPLVGAFGFQQPAALEVVGIFEVVDPRANFWLDDPSLNEPSLVPVGLDVTLVYATALASPEAFPALFEYFFPARYTWRHYVDPGRLDAGAIEQLVQDLRRMEAEYASFASVPSDVTTLQTGLLELTEAFLAERRAAEAILTTAAIGPAAIAAAAIGVLSVLTVGRRRRSLILLRGRGGSAGQILGSHVVEGLLLSVPAAALGAVLAARFVEARTSPWSTVAAGIVAVVSILTLVGVALPAVISPLRRLEREEPSGSIGPRRLVFEGAVVALAIIGVVLLRQRGIAGGSAAGALGGVDPFLAAVPALVGVAVAIVTVRLYPLPVRVAGWLAAGGRGLVPALGLRRAERQRGAGQLPLVVVLLTVAIGAFSATMLSTIDRGQSLATWQTVGAAHRVTVSTPLPSDVELGDVPGVAAVAAAHEVDASIGIAGGTRVELVAIDAADYEEVTAGTPAETVFPPAFTQPPTDERPGTTELPIPAIVSRSLIGQSSQPLRIGARFEMALTSRFATFVVVEIRREMPGVRAGRPFVVVPRDQLRASLLDRPLVATSLFVRASTAARAALVEALDAAPIDWELSSQADVHAQLRSRPLVQAVERGFAVSLAVALAYASLAITISMLLAGSGRARETAQLRTLGLHRSQVAGLALLEHGPPVLMAVAAGLALGVGVGWLVLPGLGLGAFTGSDAEPLLAVETGELLALTGTLAVIVLVGVGLAARSQGRGDPARAVREAGQ